MEIYVKNSIKNVLIFFEENIFKSIHKYFALFWILKSRLLIKIWSRSQKKLILISNSLFSAYASQPTSKTAVFDYWWWFWDLYTLKNNIRPSFVHKKNFVKKKSENIFSISWFSRTAGGHQKSHCACIRNHILNNLSKKSIQKIVLNFCESRIALKSYGQFPDYPIAFESNPNVPVCGFASYC